MDNFYGYIEPVNGGWFNIKMDNGTIEPICEYTRVYVGELKNSRHHFTILEGVLKGRKASIKDKNGWFWDQTYFESSNYSAAGGVISKLASPHKSEAKLTFKRVSKELEVHGLGTFNAFSEYATVPLVTGDHKVKIPDQPHKGGDNYLKKSEYAKTWFRLSDKGDKYLHCGSQTAGCITVTDIKDWDKIYNYLVLRRKDMDSIGTVTIKDI